MKREIQEGMVDFAITARKYKTLLTNKYKLRRQWVTPNPYEVQASIPGTVVKVLVEEGQIVREGEPLLILEAMKMQNHIEMPFTARVKKIHVTDGEKIPKDMLIAELDPLL